MSGGAGREWMSVKIKAMSKALVYLYMWSY